MKRVVETSAGFLVLEFTGRNWTTVEAHDEDGWRTSSRPFRLSDDGAAEEAVAAVAELPQEEIRRIVAETLAQYDSRGGEAGAKVKVFGRRSKRS